MCFGAVGDAIGDVFHSVDTVANEINPFKGITDWGTKNTLGKIPGVGKPLGQLADWGDSHPAEVGAAIGAGWAAAAYGGAGAAGEGLGGDAGAGAAEGGTAMGPAAGTLGAADSATVPMAADVSVGTTGAGGATATAGATGAAATSPWVTGLETAAKYAAPAVISSLLQPKPPKTKAPTAMPDPLAQQQAQQQKLLAQLARRGRSSTILTNPSVAGGSLGG